MTTESSLRDRCALTLPNDMGYLPTALGFVRNVAEHLGFAETDLHRIELAVEEATTNVIKHAFPAGELASFDIVCRKIAGGLEVCVHDKGLPWDPTLDEDYRPDADLAHQSGRGLGEYLIKHLMDEYTYANLGHDGKQVRLVKYLDSLRIGPSKDNSPTPARGGRPRQQTEPVEYEIRRMRPNEAIEISRTVFQSYGYSYANEFVYYPDRIAAMNQSGQMLSAVAVLRETGEIAGHSALLFNNDLPAEVAVAVTKPEFRGQGIARRLGEYLEGQACNMGLKGLYMKEVTVHPYTQKFAEKLGFRDCGMLLAHSPKTLSFKGIADEPSQRNSDVLGFRLIADPPLRELYLPERHAAVISSLYNSLGIPLHPRSTKAVPDVTQKTVVKSVVSPLRSVCEIHFSRYGGDLLGMLKQELRRIRRQEVKLVEMYLRLTDPLTPWIVPQAEKMGFFFSGILPETPGGDSVILQYFNGIQVEYDELVIVRPGTAAVLEYIKTLDPTMA